ncbi:hypothetical protein [Amycolatopsis tucumanensis]|uniref:LuxR family transcriptional regulator n=1 Tax=Amycolatopsis tucumanensis TaxID=401106 RepID=A0ABP7I301_9PSEU|nr:hypothetical protein [Amycolatopsis tucumanensis]MCF6428735.1 hypothetical protein [Amycolatopsis tucumanensis]
MHEIELRRAAFGDRPAPPPDVLAAAGPPKRRLLGAIVLGAQGRYAAATTLLDGLARDRDPVVAALALATLASHRRQLGGHAVARGLDGAALRRAATAAASPSDPDPDGLDARGALADALLGLAADHLGTGRLTASRRLLDRAAGAVDSWRTRTRLGWVTAELALASGDAPAAVAPAEAALDEATAAGSIRHTVKSQLVLAAALGTIGQKRRAGELVSGALADADKYELSSLSWPAGLIAADLWPADADRHRSRTAAVLYAVLLSSDPGGRRLAHGSPWVPV